MEQKQGFQPQSRIIEKQDTPQGNCWIAWHAQEYRPVRLAQPIHCDADDAWLGPGCYFWLEHRLAEWWGRSKKKPLSSTEEYEVYRASLLLSDEQVLNTSFSEEDYATWTNTINRSMVMLRTLHNEYAHSTRKFGLKSVMELVQKLLKDLGVGAVVFDDFHGSSKAITYTSGKGNREIFLYDKRFQLVVFDLEGILTKLSAYIPIWSLKYKLSKC